MVAHRGDHAEFPDNLADRLMNALSILRDEGLFTAEDPQDAAATALHALGVGVRPHGAGRAGKRIAVMDRLRQQLSVSHAESVQRAHRGLLDFGAACVAPHRAQHELCDPHLLELRKQV